MKKIKELVASAVNFDANRGDTLEVANMQFAQGEAPKDQGSSADLLMGVPKADLFHAVETLILALIGLLVVLLVVRPILRKRPRYRRIGRRSTGPAGRGGAGRCRRRHRATCRRPVARWAAISKPKPPRRNPKSNA